MRLLQSSFLSFIFLIINSQNALAATTVPEDVKLSDLTIVFANITSVVAAVAGFMMLIVLVRGGLSYMLAQGDTKATAQARNALTWGVIGFIVILAAYIIISIIVGYVSLPGIGRFCLPREDTDAATYCQGL